MAAQSKPLRWRYNGRDSVSNHQPHDCFLNRLFRHRSEKTLKLCVTGLCVGNSPEAGEFPAQMASNAENVSIWWRHHAYRNFTQISSTWAPFTDMYSVKWQHTWTITFIIKYGIELQIHFQTLTAQPLTFGNGYTISSHTLLGMRSLSHAAFKVDPCK